MEAKRSHPGGFLRGNLEVDLHPMRHARAVVGAFSGGSFRAGRELARTVGKISPIRMRPVSRV
jgi:hypothetical protein